MKLPTNQIQIQVIDLFHVTQSMTCQYGMGYKAVSTNLVLENQSKKKQKKTTLVVGIFAGVTG